MVRGLSTMLCYVLSVACCGVGVSRALCVVCCVLFVVGVCWCLPLFVVRCALLVA